MAYLINVEIEGITPLLQHKFGVNTHLEMEKPLRKRTGVPDYSSEWKDTCYLEGDQIVQPSLHIEMAMVKAAAGYRLPGGRGKTYKDLFLSSVFVRPAFIPHGVRVPEKPEINAFEERVYLDVRPVVVNRGARVLRVRLALKPGWRLAFQVSVEDDQIQKEVVKRVIEAAGQTVGIGDHRPRFGRFSLIKFDLI